MYLSTMPLRAVTTSTIFSKYRFSWFTSFCGVADRFGYLGEPVDVGEQHDHEPLLPLEDRPRIVVRLLDDVRRNVRLEGRQRPFHLPTFDAGSPCVPPDVAVGGLEALDHQVERLRQLPDLVVVLDLHPLPEVVRRR